MMARADATTPAAPMPMRARAAMSISVEELGAASPHASPNTA